MLRCTLCTTRQYAPEGMANNLVEWIVPKWGVPAICLSDNEKQFTVELSKAVLSPVETSNKRNDGLQSRRQRRCLPRQPHDGVEVAGAGR